MALTSMTGFGAGRACGRGVALEVELSSVNRRQLELRASLPPGMEGYEAFIHRQIAMRISRGAVNAQVRLTRPSGSSAPAVKADVCLARSVAMAARRIASELGLQEQLRLSELALFPGVICVSYPAVDRSVDRKLLGSALGKAVAALIAMRRREGRKLEMALKRRIRRLTVLLKRMRDRAPVVAGRHAALLRRRLKAAGWKVEADDPVLRRELALFAERCDISEELTRIESHLERFQEEMKSRKPAGRTLDFICQELLRESTTAGSKANDSFIGGLVIEFKALVEEIREQVQNVE